MDMHSLIHHPPSTADSLRAPSAFPSAAAAAATTSLPGLRAHFPSLPIRLPMIRPASPPDRVMPSLSSSSNNSSSNNSSMTQDPRRPPQAPVAAASTTLAPLRFIIPSSHCSSSSMNHAYSSTASSDSVSFRSVGIKAEPEQEPQSSSQTYAQVSAAVAAPQTQMNHFKKEETTQFEHSHHASGDAVFSIDADDGLKTKEKKSTPKRARAIKNSNRSTKSKARPGLRKGKWTDEESRYATQLTNYFKEGLLPIERGTMLRLYLSQKLNCEPMRITKKFTGGECIGKQVFRPCSPTPESRVRLVQAQLELVALEAAFIKKLKENREEAPGSMDNNDSGSNTENGPVKQHQASNKKRSGNSSSDDEGFTSDSSNSSSPSFPRNNAILKKTSASNGEDDADNANAVGLLLDFFYKANRNEKSDGASKCSSSATMPPAASAASQSFESDSIANSPTKRIRALSISNYVNDDSLAKRSRVGSFTTVFANVSIDTVKDPLRACALSSSLHAFDERRALPDDDRAAAQLGRALAERQIGAAAIEQCAHAGARRHAREASFTFCHSTGEKNEEKGTKTNSEREREMDELRVSLLAESDSSAAVDGVHVLASPGRSARVRDFTIRGRALADRAELPLWMYPPDGETRDVCIPSDELSAIRGRLAAPPSHLLGEWPSTAICGNDILASVLYSSGIVAGKAGKLMPLTQVLVAAVLYLFRYIYEEAVTAIPLNGGSYNVLLNTTSKRTAAVAATLGIISYLATGVVSGTSALQYLNTQVELPVVGSTVALLFAFALLSIVGIAESSTVALAIFALHVVTLTLLSGCSGYYAITHPHVLVENLKTDFPSVNVAGDLVRGNLLTAIFFGYSSAMLGITGFETSAQFVEEQAPGVFRKTLKNMWVFATFYNILLSCLSLAVLPLEGPEGIYANRDIVLARMGRVSMGQWLERWVSVDAFVVLSGGVLTSYVGITGLVRRLAYDRVLPSFLTKVNECRNTNHYIILIFFAVQASLVILLNADASILAGVFTFAFLGVMSLFAFGCMLLKLKREDIPRDVMAPWWSCIFGLVMVLLGLLGNLLGDPAIFTYFALYFIGFAAIMFLMLERVFMLRIVLYALQRLCPSRNRDGKKHKHTGAIGGRTITTALQAIHLPPIVFFCKSPDLSVLNKAILYVRQNEQTHNLRIVHVCDDLSSDNVVTEADKTRRHKQQVALQDLHDMVGMLDLMYPKLKIDFVSVSIPSSGGGGSSPFDPSIVQWVSQQMGVPTNMMFIRQPGSKTIHQVASLGVRVITG